MRYPALIRSSLITMLAYKFEYFTSIVSLIIEMLVLFALWSSIYTWNHSNSIGGLALQEMITYSIVAMLIHAFSRTWVEWDIADHVRSGELAMLLCKPIDYQVYVFFAQLGGLIGNVLLKILPALLVAIFAFGIMLPTPANAAIFMVSLLLAFLVFFALWSMIGIVSFWTTGSIWGFVKFGEVMFALFAGSFIPLAFFPDWFQSVAALLPFQAAFSSPLQIYLGKLTGEQIVGVLAVQLFWAVVLLMIGRLALKSALRNFTSQGG